MPSYEFVTIDERGPEPLIRIRETVDDLDDLIAYKVTQEDVDRVKRFTLASVALKFTGDEDNEWVIRDVNDDILDDKLLKVGDVVNIPRVWHRIAEAGRKSVPSGRTRVSRTVR